MEKITNKPTTIVIGGGPCGFLSVRHLKEVSNVIAFEAKPDLGGLWLYSEKTDDEME